jgi:hypothetical protein
MALTSLVSANDVFGGNKWHYFTEKSTLTYLLSAVFPFIAIKRWRKVVPLFYPHLEVISLTKGVNWTKILTLVAVVCVIQQHFAQEQNGRA